MKLLDKFHNAILSKNSGDIAAEIKPHPILSPHKQFSIYSSGYRERLLQAVRSDYPALLNLLGDKKFNELAISFIEENPPQSYNLDLYPHKFAWFLDGQGIEKFTCDVAVLESLISEIFMLPDSKVFNINSSEISPEEFGNLILKPRVASRLLEFSYPVNDFLSAFRAGDNVDPAEYNKNAGDYRLFIIRHNNEVKRHSLGLEEASLLKNLISGVFVSVALDLTIEHNHEYTGVIAGNLNPWFARWVKEGFFMGD